MSDRADRDPLRVLIFAPIGRDADLTAVVLRRADLPCEVCRTMGDLCAGFDEGAGAILLTEEALRDPRLGELTSQLEAQPAWSDIAVLLFAGSEYAPASLSVQRLAVLRNVTLLERPIRSAVVVSTIQAALRGRRRQYELRDVLTALYSARTEAEAANRLKDEFLATLSHELRTPLNAILGWVTMLQRQQLPPHQVSRALDVVERNAKAQAQLVADVLDVSRMITGRIRLDPAPTDLISVLVEAVDSVRPTAETKELRLDLHVGCESATVRGDAQRLQQVFWNLLSNAVKFTPAGGTIDVYVRREEAWALVSVADSGIGLAPDFLPFVFDRFRQADQTFTRPHGGLGLGLAIVKHLVELHGGDVTAASDGIGRGATFRVRVPLVASAAEPVVPRDRPMSDTAPDLSACVVLVVDDDDATRELLTAMLERQGARVHAVPSAASALAQIEREVPSLMLADIGMPGEDGLSLMRLVRARVAGRLPAIALSAYARAEDRRAALSAGFDDFVAKPALPDEIFGTIGKHLSPSAPADSRPR